jgi:hypothetical protein
MGESGGAAAATATASTAVSTHPLHDAGRTGIYEAQAHPDRKKNGGRRAEGA